MILQQLQGIIKLLLGAEILPDEVSLKIVPAKDFYTAKYLQQVKNMQVCRKKKGIMVQKENPTLSVA